MLLKSLFVICFSKFKFYRKLKTCLILSECDPCEKTQITSPNMIIMSSNANPSHRSFLQPVIHHKLFPNPPTLEVNLKYGLLIHPIMCISCIWVMSMLLRSI